MRQDNLYFTKDLGVAAVLVALGNHLRNISWKDEIAHFTFENKEECEKTAHLFLFGTIMINARVYNESLRTLKGEVVLHKKEVALRKGGEKNGRT